MTVIKKATKEGRFNRLVRLEKTSSASNVNPMDVKFLNKKCVNMNGNGK